MFKQLISLQFVTTTVLLSVLSGVAIVSDFATAQNLNNAQSLPMQNNMRARLLLPELPPDDVEYRILQPGEKITGRLGLPAAQFINIPAELAQEIAVWVPPKNIETLPPDAIGTEFLSVVRYKGNGHTIYVSTARFTPKSAQLKHTFGKEDKLADGTTVGFTISCDSITPTQHEAGYICWPDTATPNRVVFMKGNQIITVASDLPIDQVKSLATSAALK